MKWLGRAVTGAATTGAIVAALAGCTTSAPSSTQSPSPGQSASGQSASGQSSAGQSSTGQSASGQSASGQSASGQARPAGSSSAAAHPVSPAACKQQYETWQHGPGKGLVAAVTAVGSASASGDPAMLTAALKKAKPALSRAARYPMPVCADPKGYWVVLLMHVNAAAGSANSATRLTAAVKGIPEIANALLAELKHTETAA
jgi:hypothetical protein